MNEDFGEEIYEFYGLFKLIPKGNWLFLTEYLLYDLMYFSFNLTNWGFFI